MSFTNLYYKRTTATAKACYVCYKPTTTVLSTINATDFLYTCDGHLSDPGFATSVGESGDGAAGTRKMGLSAEEIAKVKEEWEEKQKKKMEKEKEKNAQQEKEGSEAKEAPKDSTKENSHSPKLPGTLAPAPPKSPPHQRYALHRDFFSMRLAEHRKKRQTAQAKDLAPRFPGAPKGTIL